MSIKINVDFIYPPIGTRKFDYQATVEGHEEDSDLYGYGTTVEEALSDLAERIAENEGVS